MIGKRDRIPPSPPGKLLQKQSAPPRKAQGTVAPMPRQDECGMNDGLMTGGSKMVALLLQPRPGVVLLNVARNGLVDEPPDAISPRFIELARRGGG